MITRISKKIRHIVKSQYVKVDKNEIYNIVSQFSSTIENMFAELNPDDNLFNHPQYINAQETIPCYDCYDLILNDLTLKIYLTVGILKNKEKDQEKHIVDGLLGSKKEYPNTRLIIIGFNVYLQKQNFNRNKFINELSFTIAHEISHAKKEILTGKTMKQIHDPYGDFKTYYNSKMEVEANLTALINEIQNILENNPQIINKYPDKKDLLFYILSLTDEWRDIREYLNNDNKKYILKKCYIVISNILENNYE